ncbi:ATP-binding cassette domain-containing protein [Rhizobium sp. WW22]|uniref:ATP-binding cassette domain-containing protein n=1 Tax=Rhizobium sp. WW22 TaxID=3389070 RepID=UPI00399BC7D8
MIKDDKSILKLADGQRLTMRRFFPAGTEDYIVVDGDSTLVWVKNENRFLEIGKAWSCQFQLEMPNARTTITFKEIETAEELALYDELRKFHYRGGGGIGRTVPLIGTSDQWDLPSVLGFIEISSSMIANTARKRFFDFPYGEPGGPHWKSWDRAATKKFSNIICRISRFVIHPEIRGLGIAKHFTAAAREYAASRWHFGGYRPRFLEITADMLRYYKFVDPSFALMGETEGNEHRLAKDMTYLIRKSRSDLGTKGMPQGGGGIMTLQRAYAKTLLKYLEAKNQSLHDVISTLRHDAAVLDQDMWEALHRLNRRPKPSFVSGLTPCATAYIDIRRKFLHGLPAPKLAIGRTRQWKFEGVEVRAIAKMAQTSDARLLQDAFGFVGSDLKSTVVQKLDLQLTSGEVTLVCGASGSGKSLLLNALSSLLQGHAVDLYDTDSASLLISGEVDHRAKVGELPALPEGSVPIALRGRASLEDFIRLAAKCGLAEPQMFVRPVESLSSGQQYRLQIALAFLNNPEVLLIDNFCEPLDRYTAIAVSKGVRQLAKELNVAVVVATATYDRILPLGDVNQTILLRRGDKPVTNFKARDEVHKGL